MRPRPMRPIRYANVDRVWFEMSNARSGPLRSKPSGEVSRPR